MQISYIEIMVGHRLEDSGDGPVQLLRQTLGLDRLALQPVTQTHNRTAKAERQKVSFVSLRPTPSSR